MSDDTKDWKIIGEDGTGGYLIQTGPDFADPMCTGRVLDLSAGILFPEFIIQAILNHRGFEKYTGSQDLLPGLLARVKRHDRYKDLPDDDDVALGKDNDQSP